MPNPWFRLYSEFEDDPKVQMLPEAMQRRLIMLFCQKCKGEKRTDAQIAFKLHISLSDLAETKKLFLANGFIDAEWNLPNWNRRQFLSDSSTDRVRRHRERSPGHKNMGLKQDETLHNVSVKQPVTPPDTDTDSEQIQKQKRKELASSSNELPAVFELPILGGKIYGVPETLYRSYQSAYPAISVMDQFNKMHAWLLSNATDQKTLKGMPRFMNRWLAKAQNESRGGNNGTHAIPSKTARADANLQANIQRQRANGGEGSGSGRQARVDAQPTLGGLDARRMGPAIIDIRRREPDVCVQPGGADAGRMANGKQSDQDPW